MLNEAHITMAEQQRAVIVYAALLLVSFVWLAVIFAAPVLMADGHPLSAMIIYRGLSGICHQIPERSFHMHGFPLAVCSRCTGIYIGFAVGLVFYPFLRSLRDQTMPSRHWLIAAGLPTLIDFGCGYLGLFQTTFFSRAATGALAGAAAAFYIMPGLLSIFRDFSTESFLWRKWITKSLPSSAEQ